MKEISKDIYLYQKKYGTNRYSNFVYIRIKSKGYLFGVFKNNVKLPQKEIDFINELGGVKAILITHRDELKYGAEYIQKAFDCDIHISELDYAEIKSSFGKFSKIKHIKGRKIGPFQPIFIPGHSKGYYSFVVEHHGENIWFSGDMPYIKGKHLVLSNLKYTENLKETIAGYKKVIKSKINKVFSCKMEGGAIPFINESNKLEEGLGKLVLNLEKDLSE